MGEPAHNSIDKIKNTCCRKTKVYTYKVCKHDAIYANLDTKIHIQGKMMDHQNLLYGNPKD